MTASSALFIIDALMVAMAWPPTVWFAVNGAGTHHRWLQALIFAALNLIFLYALGLYRRDSIADASKALGRIPLVVAIAVAAASFVTAAVGWGLSPALFIAATTCFAGCAMLVRLAFPLLRRHSLFHPRLLVIGAGKRAWDLIWISAQPRPAYAVRRDFRA